MASANELRTLFDYNRWANSRMLDAAAALTPEEARQEIESSFPSVLETLVHLLGAEWVWLSRWKGTSPSGFAEMSGSDGLTSVDAVRARWDELWREQLDFLEGLGDEDLERDVDYRVFSGSEDTQALGDLMRHVVNHATYHRGQLATMLRHLGRTPPSTDLIRYLRERVS